MKDSTTFSLTLLIPSVDVTKSLKFLFNKTTEVYIAPKTIGSTPNELEIFTPISANPLSPSTTPINESVNTASPIASDNSVNAVLSLLILLSKLSCAFADSMSALF